MSTDRIQDELNVHSETGVSGDRIVVLWSRLVGLPLAMPLLAGRFKVLGSGLKIHSQDRGKLAINFDRGAMHNTVGGLAEYSCGAAREKEQMSP